jgi:hypothetical protein
MLAGDFEIDSNDNTPKTLSQIAASASAVEETPVDFWLKVLAALMNGTTVCTCLLK